jgi:hypothetical protein
MTQFAQFATRDGRQALVDPGSVAVVRDDGIGCTMLVSGGGTIIEVAVCEDLRTVERRLQAVEFWSTPARRLADERGQAPALAGGGVVEALMGAAAGMLVAAGILMVLAAARGIG